MDSLTYNLKVAGALFRQVYIAEAMAPPKSFNTIQEAYKTMYSRAIDGNYWTNLVNSGEWKKFGIYALEAYGIFTIGEMVSSSRNLPSFAELMMRCTDWTTTSSRLQDQQISTSIS